MERGGSYPVRVKKKYFPQEDQYAGSYQTPTSSSPNFQSQSFSRLTSQISSSEIDDQFDEGFPRNQNNQQEFVADDYDDTQQSDYNDEYQEYHQNRLLYQQQQLNRQYQNQNSYDLYNPEFPQYQQHDYSMEDYQQYQQQYQYMLQQQYQQQQQQQASSPQRDNLGFAAEFNYPLAYDYQKSYPVEIKDNVGFDYSHTFVNANLYKEKFKRNIVLDKPQEFDDTSRDVKTDFQRELGAQVLSHLPDMQQQKFRTSWIVWCPGSSSSKDAENTPPSSPKPFDPNNEPFSVHLHSFQDIIKDQPFIADKGYDMAIRMGYNPERGLGKDEDGDMLPINVLFTRGSTGLGSVSKKKRGQIIEHCKICDRDFPINDYKTHLLSKKHQKKLLLTGVEVKRCSVCDVDVAATEYLAHTFSKKHLKKVNIALNHKLEYCEICQSSFPNFDTHLLSKGHKKKAALSVGIKKRKLSVAENPAVSQPLAKTTTATTTTATTTPTFESTAKLSNSTDSLLTPKKKQKLEHNLENTTTTTTPNQLPTSATPVQPSFLPTTISPILAANNRSVIATPLNTVSQDVLVQCPNCKEDVKEIEWKTHILTKKHKRAMLASG